MVVPSTRPHTMTYAEIGSTGGEDANGYPLPAVPGETRQIDCRFHLGGTKVFKNEDSTEVLQVGTIRCDVGLIPEGGTLITVVDKASGLVHFSGIVREVYRGQLSHRIEV